MAKNTPLFPRGSLHVGCAVWAFRGWVGSMYPEGTEPKDMLHLYGQRLTAVEGNTTFYSTPSPETTRQWASELPRGFRFCPKLARAVTHDGDLTALGPFLEAIAPLGELMGPVFAQLPGRVGPSALHEIETLLDAWPSDVPLHLEVRHEAFFAGQPREALREMLARREMGQVMLDTRPIYECPDDPQVHSERRKPKLPLLAEPLSGTALVRYIGHPTPARNEPYLVAWAEKIDAWLRQGIDVIFFAHCPMEERSPALARRFHALLRERGAEVGKLPWDEVRTRAPQLDLFGR